MIKKYLFLGLLVLFSLVLVDDGFSVREGIVTIPENKDLKITFTGFQEITVNTNHTSNILLNFRENGELNDALLQIKEINEDNVSLNVFVNNIPKWEFTLFSGQDQIIDFTKKTPFVTTNTYVFNKEGIYRAQIKLRMPFVGFGEDVNSIGVPSSLMVDPIKVSAIDTSVGVLDEQKTGNLFLKIMLVVIIILLVLIIFITARKRKL